MIPAIWSISGDVATAVLGAVFIAVFTGLLTATTTETRLHRQLAHDREIKDLELHHDRELRDVEELRSLLDEAAVLVVDAMKVGASATIQKTASEAHQARLAYGGKAMEIIHTEQRIALRLGVDHEVTKAYRQASTVTIAIRRIINEFPLSDNASEAFKQEGNRLTEAQRRFLEASRRYIGSQLPETERRAAAVDILG